MRFSKQGFTLIELLVVVGIIVLLSTIGLVSYQTTQQRSRDARRQADLEQVRAALEMYRTDIGAYPPCEDAGCTTSMTNDYATVVAKLVTDKYLSKSPVDPKTGNDYGYDSDGTTYELCAKMEKTSGTCTISGFDYGVTNP